MIDHTSLEERIRDLAEYLNESTNLAPQVMGAVRRVAADRRDGRRAASATRSTLLRAARYAAALAVAAGLLAVVVFVWGDRQSAAWAQVVIAVAQKPWLHAAMTLPDGKKSELWFSADRAVIATRTERTTCWTDLEQGTKEQYDPTINTLVRAPDEERHEASSVTATVFTTFLTAKSGGTVNAGRYRLIHQQQRTVQEDGKRWIEHRFTLHDENNPYESESAACESIVYVDPDTRLPFRWDQILQFKEVDKAIDPSKTRVFRYEIDYPGTGPANIYALGAPKTAKVLDRLLDPSRADVRRLVAGIRAARWRSDAYYALLVDGEVDQHWWECFPSYRVWRSGSRWKVERSSGYDVRRRELPPKNADPATWWKQNLEKVRFEPFDICDGKWLWNSLDNRRLPAFPPGLAKGEYLRVSDGHPEYLARPLPDLADPGNEARLDPKPASGPPNTVMLEVRGPNGSPGTRSSQTRRYWLDPERGYLVMRYEELAVHEGKEEILRGHAIEGVTQDPAGQWYPTVIRMFRKVVPMGTAKPRDGIMRCYYDFTTPIPDSMFRVD
jgi:hypothetical protein